MKKTQPRWKTFCRPIFSALPMRLGHAWVLLFVGMWFLSPYVHSQQTSDCHCLVKGVVKDRETHQPIVGAIIRIVGTAFFAFTDTVGRYKIDNLCQGNYQLECRIVGYKVIKTAITLEHSAEEDLNLSEDEVHLQDVEIVARRIQNPLSQKSSLLEGQALELTRGETLGDALKKITGVTTLQTGASISKPVIHGLHSNRVLIMNNGIRQEGQQWGSEHAPEIDPFIAKRMTVVKGAAGVRYGSDAIAGVILVEPDDLPKNPQMSGEVNAAAFSNGRIGVVSGTLQGGLPRWKGWAWRIQGTLKNGGNTRTPDYFMANTGVRENNFSVTTGYRTNRLGVEAFFSQFDSNIGIFSGSHIGSTSDLLNVIQNGEPFIKTGFTRAVERPNQRILHNLFKGKAFYNFNGNRLSWTVGRQFNRRAEFDLHGPQASTVPALLFRITTFTSDLVLEHKPLGNGKMSGQFGLSGLYQYNFADGRPLIPDFEQKNLGVFGVERWIFQQWELEAGARFDWRQLDVFRFIGKTPDPRHHQFYNGSGTVGVVHTPNDKLSFRVNFGTAWRPPTPNELYSKGVHHGAASYEEGDENLRPEVAYNLIGSVEYTSSRFKEEIGIYRNQIANFIYLKPQAEPILTIRGAFPYFKYTQTDATFTGFDLDTQYEIVPKRFTHSLKLAYLRAYDQREQGYLVFIPANRIENELRWNVGNVLSSKDTYVTVGHLWVDKQRRVPPKSDFMEPPAAYHLWNFNVGGTLISKGASQLHWTLVAQNALNTSYRDYLNRFRYFATEQGRNVSLKLRYTF